MANDLNKKKTLQYRDRSTTDRKQHDWDIERIVEQTGAPDDEVRSVYQSTLERYQREARVADFVSIFVSREVTDILTKRKQRR